MKRNNLIDFLIMLLLYIGLKAIPFERFISIEWLTSLIQILIQGGLLVFYSFYVKKKTDLIVKIEKINWKNALILLPTFIVCFSNFIYMGFSEPPYRFDFDYMIFVDAINCLLYVINEEIIFRFVLLNNLEFKSKFLRILVSALCFGMIHIVNLAGGFSGQVFVQMGYTFALGLLLGAIFLLTSSLKFTIAMHFLFNLSNQIVFESFSFSGNLRTYYLVNIIVALITALYLIGVMAIKRFKTKKH